MPHLAFSSHAMFPNFSSILALQGTCKDSSVEAGKDIKGTTEAYVGMGGKSGTCIEYIGNVKMCKDATGTAEAHIDVVENLGTCEEDTGNVDPLLDVTGRTETREDVMWLIETCMHEEELVGGDMRNDVDKMGNMALRVDRTGCGQFCMVDANCMETAGSKMHCGPASVALVNFPSMSISLLALWCSGRFSSNSKQEKLALC